MKNKLFFTAGMVGMLSGVASGATDGAEVDYGREWSPYVTLRGGWLFGKGKYRETLSAPGGSVKWDFCNKIRNAFASSLEMGTLCCDGCVSVGLEAGYFASDLKSRERTVSVFGVDVPTVYMLNVDNIFGACNVTLRRDMNERMFVYGGVGAGMARSRFRFTWLAALPNVVEAKTAKTKWCFLGQVFAGLGVHLGDDWQLTLGYRLRYLPGDFKFKKEVTIGGLGDVRFDASMKRNVIHAAEIGLTYSF